MKCRMLLLFLILHLVFGIPYGVSGSPAYCPYRCVIPYLKNESFNIPAVPDFLKNVTATVPATEAAKKLCWDVNNENQDQSLSCGSENQFLKKECICNFHHVSNDIYHKYQSCNDNSKTNDVKTLTCSQCREHSVNKTGPCLNGGKINDCDKSHLAVDVNCSCPPDFVGKFCEMITVTRYMPCYPNATNEILPICDGESTGKCKNGSFTCCPNANEETLDTLPRCDSLDTQQLNQWSGTHLTNTGTVCENRLTMFVLLYMVAKYFKTIGS
ncbi:uncharacterized protein LOC111127271 [Crassostrea virginica]